MTKTINPAKVTLEFFLFPLFFIVLCISTSVAQDFKSGVGQDLFISANILSIAANINSDRMSISYNGISDRSGVRLQSNRNSYPIDSQKSGGTDFEKFDAPEESLFRFGEKLKHMTHYFLRYFNVDDISSEDTDSKFLLKSKTDTGKLNSNDFEFNLSLNVGYDGETILKLNAVKLESYWRHTYVNAVYQYEKSEFELGLSSGILNAYLLDGMKLEFQANPVAGSGAVLLTMSI